MGPHIDELEGRRQRSLDPNAMMGHHPENNMLVEFLHKLINLGTPHRWDEEDGRVYTNRNLEPVQSPLQAPVVCQTLTGLVDLYRLHDPECLKPFIYIPRYDRVELVDRELDSWRRRECFAKAETPADGMQRYQFGQFHEPDQFVVMLQTLFEDYNSHDFHRVLNLASNLASEAVNISTDDGVSQTVATRQGVVMKGEIKVVPRVSLAPYCTFREIAQPTRELLIRLRTRPNATPLVALFEADGGEWRNTAIESIKKYFLEKVPGADIVA